MKKLVRPTSGELAWQLRVLKLVRKPYEKFLMKFSQVPDTPILEENFFSWIPALESATPAIAAEVSNLMHSQISIPAIHQLSPMQARLSSDDSWKTFIIMGYSKVNAFNRDLCPATYAAVKEVPGLRLAMFSILEPGKEIPLHRGPYKGLIRYHLGLIIPADPTTCAIKIAEDVRHWQSGRSLVFDDTYEHEAWNHGDSKRIILLLDVERPLSAPGRVLNRVAFGVLSKSQYVKQPQARLEEYQYRLTIDEALKEAAVE